MIPRASYLLPQQPRRVMRIYRKSMRLRAFRSQYIKKTIPKIINRRVMEDNSIEFIVTF